MLYLNNSKVRPFNSLLVKYAHRNADHFLSHKETSKESIIIFLFMERKQNLFADRILFLSFSDLLDCASSTGFSTWLNIRRRGTWCRGCAGWVLHSAEDWFTSVNIYRPIILEVFVLFTYFLVFVCAYTPCNVIHGLGRYLGRYLRFLYNICYSSDTRYGINRFE